jgi:hypothetical protein
LTAPGWCRISKTSTPRIRFGASSTTSIPGDNITPPGQALGWIVDLYKDVDEIRSYGQTIICTVHETVGHLGIFVSSGVARKEHGELSSNIDLIDTLPPGLYEAVLERKGDNTASGDLVSGDWVMRCEARTLEDIRKLGCNDAAEDRCFATAARISETNLSLYRAFAQPAVRALASAPLAQWLQKLHPLRVQYELFSDANPLMAGIGRMAEWVKEHRRPAAKDNPFIALQEAVSEQIVAALDSWRDARDTAAERTFFSVYGSPAVQAIAGIDDAAARTLRTAGRSRLHHELLQARIADLKSKLGAGGPRAAVIRALIYAGMARGEVDERGFEMVRRIRRTHGDMPLSEFKALVREQFLILLIDPEGALAALPAMMPPEPKTRHEALLLLKQVLGTRGEISGEVAERLARVSHLLAIDAERKSIPPAADMPLSTKLEGQAHVQRSRSARSQPQQN